MSPDPTDAYFADGLTDEVISAIARIPELVVISRTSVMQYRDRPKPMAEIGRELRVGTIVEGSVRKVDSHVRIAVQLIDAASDRHLWVESYDRNLRDIYAVQSEIADRIANALQIRLVEGDGERLGEVPTRDPEAHLLYLKALSQERRYEKEGLLEAIQNYELAVQKDPGYALAYAAISRCHLYLGQWDMIAPEEMGQKAEEAAKKALDLEPDLPDAHVVMGWVLRDPPYHDLDGARKEFSRALELNPSLPAAHLSYSDFSILTHQPEEARRAARRAVELDPLCPQTLESAGSLLLHGGGSLEEAVRLFEKALQIDPTSLARDGLGLCRVRQGRWDEGIAEIRRSIVLDRGFSAAQRADLVYALVQAGRTDEARSVLEERLEHHRTHNAGAGATALAFARLGDADQALEWLETAYRERSPYLDSLDVEFGLEKLRADPRYDRILEKIGHPSKLWARLSHPSPASQGGEWHDPGGPFARSRVAGAGSTRSRLASMLGRPTGIRSSFYPAARDT